MRISAMARRIVILAGVCVLGLIGANPAQAAVQRTDRFSITEQHFDFGDGDLGNVSGRPKSDGRLEWDLVAGRWEPRLVGRLYINNASGECVRIQMVVVYQNGVTTTDTDSLSDFCAPNGQTWRSEVDFRPVSSAYVASVYFRLQSAPAGGWAFSTEATTGSYAAPWLLP
ncbi:hypothetical protein LADH09A_002829 [Micromonospora sp. LAH09]|uniref:hypothetical protein n=1 Tax=Micromonospora cabrerizensis TaxID=2911213 RepID=UPI001EE85AC5|nr:hypothetical protein [Micromonospora cabrerizensis]MCG5468928.1 hypothetical protein [Micromonospora cabrerizensis]